MVKYSKVNVKLTDTQLKNLKKINNNLSKINDLKINDVHHELLLTTRQKTTDKKLSKAKIPKIIQSERFLGSLLSKLASSLMKVAVPVGKKYFSSIRNYSWWSFKKSVPWGGEGVSLKSEQKLPVGGGLLAYVYVCFSKKKSEILKMKFYCYSPAFPIDYNGSIKY